jgi:hypothetical protein
MAEQFFHVALPESAKTHLTDGKDKLIVSAESSAEALLAAKAYLNLPSDAAWAAATATALAHVTDLVGWRARINISLAGVTVEEVTVTAVATDDFDDIGGDLVTALNATTSIANAAYATPNLTISSIADAIGDHKVTVSMLPPVTWDDSTIVFSSLFGTIVDEGIAAAALTVVLNDVVAPTVLYQVN